ncbi:inactive peptidyl-prolyl cis-trans isomerase shutdown-like [Drosophila miranda]|uniref:inactive peptidyl-prolyl cis-trans isomerase shutdown-like n=1 Tax=Drosophila miranda TaxID=7229 RepID=UPI00143F7223|nr:inactive peptidyl-prolyl cis-trans isomerase shutdown-like [Drosophila miranda]
MADNFSYCTQMLKEPLQLGKLVGSGSQFEVEQSPFGAGDDDFNVDEMEDCDNAPDVDEEELAEVWCQTRHVSLCAIVGRREFSF